MRVSVFLRLLGGSDVSGVDGADACLCDWEAAARCMNFIVIKLEDIALEGREGGAKEGGLALLGVIIGLEKDKTENLPKNLELGQKIVAEGNLERWLSKVGGW